MLTDVIVAWEQSAIRHNMLAALPMDRYDWIPESLRRTWQQVSPASWNEGANRDVLSGDLTVGDIRAGRSAAGKHRLAAAAAAAVVVVTLLLLRPQPAGHARGAQSEARGANGEAGGGGGSGSSTDANSTTSLLRRRGVMCAADGDKLSKPAHQGSSECWSLEEMAQHAASQHRCYFAIREPLTALVEECTSTMHLCAQPLRLEAAVNVVVYSACPDADPVAAPLMKSHGHSNGSPQGLERPGVSHATGVAQTYHATQETQMPGGVGGTQASGLPAHVGAAPDHQATHARSSSPHPMPSAGALLGSSSPPPPPPPPPPTYFVTVDSDGRGFERAGKPMRFVGTTMWYGAHLAARDRGRLDRELDDLARLGVKHIRVLASSEGSGDDMPYQVQPTFQPHPSEYARDMLEGLDYFLAALASRNLLAVLVLNNGQPWSGGLAQHVAWVTDTKPPFSGLRFDSEAYYQYTGHFFRLEEAMVMADTYARTLIGRRNSITGVMYRNDPTIFAWEIANEPRGPTVSPEYQAWVRRLGRLIKSLDRNHLVALGSDGTGGLGPFRAEFDHPEVDFTTVHMWPEKFKWFDGEQADVATAIGRARGFLTSHVQWSEQMGKPLVVEAFALSRDLRTLDPSGPTTQRDEFYTAMFSDAEGMMRGGRGLGGISFWGWAGEGRPAPARAESAAPAGLPGWREGDAFTGDPPSERQGLFSVYSSDASTCSLIKHFAHRISAIREREDRV